MPSATMTKLQALQAVPWLVLAGAQALSELAQRARFELLMDGQELFVHGHDVSQLAVVVSGQLEASSSNEAGKRHVVGWVNAGEVAGLIPLLDQSGAINDLHAKGFVQLLLIPRIAFQQCLSEHPALSEQVIKLLAQRSRQLYQAAAERAMVRVPVRLARALLSLSQSQGADRLAMPQSDLAELLGVTRQTANLELKKMERAGWLRLSRSVIELLNRPALVKLAAL